VSGCPDRPLLSTGAAGRMLGVSRQTVLRWARSGALPVTRTLGGHLRFHASDVVSLSCALSANAIGPPGRPPWRPANAQRAEPSSPLDTERSGE
jgi:excisionase family DNA binding protein